MSKHGMGFVDNSTTSLDRLSVSHNNIAWGEFWTAHLTPVKMYVTLYTCEIRKYASQLLNNVVVGTGQRYV